LPFGGRFDFSLTQARREETRPGEVTRKSIEQEEATKDKKGREEYLEINQEFAAVFFQVRLEKLDESAI
jgi:hypothetical protein